MPATKAALHAFVVPDAGSHEMSGTERREFSPCQSLNFAGLAGGRMSTSIRHESVHPGWLALAQRLLERRATRRQFISSAAASAGGLALWSALPSGFTAAAIGLPDLANWPSNNKIKHIVILCQENRSFDHYFGAFV